MDHEGAPVEDNESTPIFGAYRRGYDPEQVDRYVADQQRRLDDATTRASEAERKLASAVGQLRELHRRVSVLEGEERPQAPSLDTLGERVQRILQEAWEGAYALRQNAETEANEIRERVSSEAQDILTGARHKAELIDEEIERRRTSYLHKLEEDRKRAIATIQYLHDQRQTALDELLRVKDVIEETVADVAPLRKASPRPAGTGPGSEGPVLRLHTEEPPEPAMPEAPVLPSDAPPQVKSAMPAPAASRREPRAEEPVLPKTMPVHHLPPAVDSSSMPDRSNLVHSHRASVQAHDVRRPPAAPPQNATPVPSAQHHEDVFDFDAQ